MQVMRKALPLSVLLVAIAACSSFQSQRVRQYNAVLEEGYKQVAIYLDAGKLTADQGEAVIASLDIAKAQVARYWESVKTGAPQDVRKAIIAAIERALAAADAIIKEGQK